MRHAFSTSNSLSSHLTNIDKLSARLFAILNLLTLTAVLSVTAPAQTSDFSILDSIESPFSPTANKVNKLDSLNDTNLTANAAAPLATVIVSPNNLNGFAFFQEVANASGTFVFGPGTPPLGQGSAQLTVDNTGREILFTRQFAGTRLDAITELKYSAYRNSTANPNVTITLQFDVDYDLADMNTAFMGRLVFEPAANGITVAEGVFQTFDTLDTVTGKFFATGAPGNGTCTQASPCTKAQLLAAFPNVGIRATGSNLLLLKLGGPTPGGLTANADALSITVNGVNTTFDFEPAASTLVVDDDGMASATNCDAGDAAPMTIQSAVNVANPGDTIKVCPGTYSEKVTTNKNLNFSGPQAGVDARTGRTTPANEAVVGISTGAFDLQLATPGTTTLDGFTLTGATVNADTPALLLSGGSNHLIVNNIIEGNSRGVFFTSPGTTFRRNRLNNTSDGIFGGVDNVTVEENLFTGGHPNGAVNTTVGSGDPTVNNYRLINNVSNASGNFGVIFATVGSLISGNTINNTTGSALFVGGGNSSLTVQNNVFTGTQFQAIVVSDFGFGYGNNSNINFIGNIVTRAITDTGSGFATIDYRGVAGINSISSNRVTLARATGATTGSGYAIRLRGSGSGDFTISGNFLDGGNLIAPASTTAPPTAGLFLSSNTPPPSTGTTPATNIGQLPGSSLITGNCNTITRFQDGITVFDAVNNTPGGLVATVAINASNITGNTNFGINNGGTSATINAENNYWGAANGPGPVGPGSGDRVTLNVDFDPFLTAPSSCAPTLGTTAATTTISGRVLSSNGLGLARVSVILTELATGQTRITRTNKQGLYNFDEVEVGENYVISLSLKGYSFSPSSKQFSLFGELSDVDFTASREKGKESVK